MVLFQLQLVKQLIQGIHVPVVLMVPVNVPLTTIVPVSPIVLLPVLRQSNLLKIVPKVIWAYFVAIAIKLPVKNIVILTVLLLVLIIAEYLIIQSVMYLQVLLQLQFLVAVTMMSHGTVTPCPVPAVVTIAPVTKAVVVIVQEPLVPQVNMPEVVFKLLLMQKVVNVATVFG